jgi:hypothetical protein
MKKILLGVGLIILSMAMSLMAQPRWENANFQRSTGTGLYTAISSMPAQDLSDDEKSGLLKMRQEEKLARDVYLKLYEKWGLQVFANIANSEQRHMEAVKMLLEKYGISDPVIDDSIGVFSDEEFSGLFNELVATGEASEVDALKVGAEIEDLDISDLETLIANTDNDDIKFVYERLMNGSYNHMRAFSNMLQSYGESYTPKYISEDEYNEILSTQSQTQRGKGRKGSRGGRMGMNDGSCLYNTYQ